MKKESLALITAVLHVLFYRFNTFTKHWWAPGSNGYHIQGILSIFKYKPELKCAHLHLLPSVWRPKTLHLKWSFFSAPLLSGGRKSKTQVPALSAGLWPGDAHPSPFHLKLSDLQPPTPPLQPPTYLTSDLTYKCPH
jgi:hypothetical protein